MKLPQSFGALRLSLMGLSADRTLLRTTSSCEPICSPVPVLRRRSNSIHLTHPVSRSAPRRLQSAQETLQILFDPPDSIPGSASRCERRQAAGRGSTADIGCCELLDFVTGSRIIDPIAGDDLGEAKSRQSVQLKSQTPANRSMLAARYSICVLS